MSSTSSVFALLMAMISIQLGASLAKGLFLSLGPEMTCGLRVILASVVLILLFRPCKTLLHLSRKQILYLLAYGISLGAMNLTFYLALQYIPLGVTVALEFSGPLAIAIFSSRRKLDLAWTALALLGILLLLPLSEGFSLAGAGAGSIAGAGAGAGAIAEAGAASGNWRGAFLALAAGFFWALYILFGKKAGQGLRGTTAVSIGMSLAALTILPFALMPYASGLRHFETVLTPHILGFGLAIAILSSALPYSLEMVALKKTPLQTFGILMSLEPVIAALTGFIFLREHLLAFQWLAIACIISASLGSTVTHREYARDIQIDY